MAAKSRELTQNDFSPVLRKIRASVQKLDASPGARPSPDFVHRGRWDLLREMRSPAGRGFSHSWRSLLTIPARLAIPRRIAVTGTAVLLAGIVVVPALAGQGPMAGSFSSATSAVERAMGFHQRSLGPTAVASISSSANTRQSSASSPLTAASTPGGGQAGSFGFSTVFSSTVEPSDDVTPTGEVTPTTEPAPIPPSSDEHGPVITSTTEPASEPSDERGPASTPTAEASDDRAGRAEPQAEQDDQDHQNDQADDVQASPSPPTDPTGEANQIEPRETDEEHSQPTVTVSPAPDTQSTPIEEQHGNAEPTHTPEHSPTHTKSPEPSDDNPHPQSTPIPVGGGDREN